MAEPAQKFLGSEEPGLAASSGTDSDTINMPNQHQEKADTEQGSPKWGNDAPDGGAAAWLCVLGAWCTSVCSFGWINSATDLSRVLLISSYHS